MSYSSLKNSLQSASWNDAASLQQQRAHLYIAPVADVHELPIRRPLPSFGQRLVLAGIAFAILFGCVQGLRCGVLSVLKIERLLHQRSAVTSVHNQAVQTQKILKNQIAVYSSPRGLEELARDGLELVREDEILVRLHPADASPAALASPVAEAP